MLFQTQKELRVTLSLRADYAAAPNDTFFDGVLQYPMDRGQFTMFEATIMDMLKGLGIANLEQTTGQAKK